MAFGFLSSIIPNADQNVTLYTSPANTLTQGKVSISSKVTNPVRIRLSIREAGGQVTDLKYLEYNKYANYAEVFETVDINIGPGQDLVVRCDHSDVSFLFSGETFDESNADLGPNVNSGLLGSLISTNTDKKELYKVPFSGDRPDLRTNATVVICNVGPTVARARIGILQNGEILPNFGVEDYIEYEVALLPGQTYTRPGVKLAAGESVVVSSSDSSNLQFLLHGRLERSTGDIATKDITASGDITGSTISVFNASVAGILTAPTINGDFPSGTLVGGGVTINGSGINAGTGIVTASSFVGEGSALTGVVTSLSATGNANITGNTGSVTINVPELTSLNLVGVSTLGVTTFTGAVGFGTTSGFPHTAKLNFGDNQEASLSVSSQFNTFVVDNKGTGDTVIRAEKIELDAFSSAGSGAQTALIVDHTGAKGTHVQLYNDADLRLETTSTGVQVSGILDTGEINYNSGTLKLSTSDTERVSVKPNGTVIFQAGVAEQFNNVGGTMTSNSTQSIQLGNVIRFTGNESGSTTLNVTGITTTIASSEAISFTVICTPNSSGYISGVQIDGVSPATSLVWSGGAPSTGSASGRDVYTFSVLRTGSATNAYEIYGSRNNYT